VEVGAILSQDIAGRLEAESIAGKQILLADKRAVRRDDAIARAGRRGGHQDNGAKQGQKKSENVFHERKRGWREGKSEISNGCADRTNAAENL
jgi:hypothetical protein